MGFLDRLFSKPAPGSRSDDFLDELFADSSPGSSSPASAGLPTDAVAVDKPLRRNAFLGLVGMIPGFDRLILATAKESIIGPYVGILESVGAADPGKRQAVRDEFEEERLRFLAEDPGPLRATIAGVTQLGTELVPLAPGGAAGKAATKALGVTGKAAKFLSGAAAGAAEGAVIAAGDRPLSDPADRNRESLMAFLGATGLGALGGGRVRPGEKSWFREKYIGDTLPDGSPKERISAMLRRQRQLWFSRQSPVREPIKKKLGKEAAEEFEILASAERTARQARTIPLVSDVIAPDGVTKLSDGLVPILNRHAPDARTLDHLEEYLAASRQLSDFEARGLAKDKAATKDSKARMAELEKLYGKERLERAAQDYYQWDGTALDVAVDIGLISRKSAEAMARDNPRHITFRFAKKMQDQGMDLGPDGVPIRDKKAFAGLMEARRVMPPIEQSALDRMRLEQFAREQRVRNHFGDVVRENPDLFGDRVRELKKWEWGKHPKERQIVHFKDGVETRFLTNDRTISDSLNRVAPSQSNAFFEAVKGLARVAARVHRLGATLLPSFSVKNWLRDPFSAAIYTRNGQLPFIDPLRLMWKAFAPDSLGGARVETRQMWQDFLRGSGRMATLLAQDMDRALQRGDVRAALDEVRKTKARRGAERLNPFKMLQELTDILERPPRFAEFALAKQGGRKTTSIAGLPIPFTRVKGAPRAKMADVDAGGVTLDFSEGGIAAKQWSQYESFGNPQFLDVGKFVKEMRERPAEIMGRGVAYLTLPALANWAYWNGHIGGDSELKEYYRKGIPEWEKLLFLHVNPEAMGLDPDDLPFRFVRIPLPPGVLGLMFSYLPQKLFDYMTDADPEGLQKALAGAVESTPLAYSPLNKDALTELMPNLVQPAFELATNRDPFRERPVVGRRFEDVPPEFRQFEEGSPTAAAIAAGARRLGAGNMAGSLENIGAPIGIEHLIRGYGASVGAALLGAGDAVAGAAGVNVRPEIASSPAERFLKGVGLRSTSAVGFNSQPVQDFYALRKEAGQWAEAYKDLLEKGQEQRAQELYSEHGALVDASRTADRFADLLRKVGDARKLAISNQSATPDERRAEMLKWDMMVSQLATLFMYQEMPKIERDYMKRQERQP